MEMHRLIAEQQIVKRALRSDEHVHHKDGNHANNALENLEVLSAAEHTRKHLPEMLRALRQKVLSDRSPAKRQILDLINSSDESFDAAKVAEALGIKRMDLVHQSLSRLFRAKKIQRAASGGHYRRLPR